MTASTDDHLSDIQIFESLLNPADLSETGNAHLAECLQCQTALDELRDDLQNVENLALAAAPKPTGSFRIPTRQAIRPLSIFTGWLSFPRLVASALSLFLVVGALLLINPDQKNPTVSEISQALDPDQLLSEIDELVETPFAAEFVPTTSIDELDADDDFMEYIVPLIETDPITRTPGRKGELLC